MIELLTEEEYDAAAANYCWPDDHDGCFPDDCGPVNGCGPYCRP
ncbi:MAG: hypothetical protein ACOX5F_07390 [Anaerovoracaceae bacterium]|jgi:hypothetical protein